MIPDNKQGLKRSWWINLPNGQEVFDWQRARYEAWASQIEAIKQMQKLSKDADDG